MDEVLYPPSGCPNGHKGGAFCCEDNVNRIMKIMVEKFEKWEGRHLSMIPVPLEQWDQYQQLLKEQEDEQREQHTTP